MAKKMTLKQYVSHWSKMSADFPQCAKEFLVEEATKVMNQAIEDTPTGETGALKNSWRLSEVEAKGKKYRITISNSMNYATFIEYGTKRGIKPRYMLTKPINEYHRTLYERFKEYWDAYRKDKGLD